MKTITHYSSFVRFYRNENFIDVRKTRENNVSIVGRLLFIIEIKFSWRTEENILEGGVV